LIFLDTDVVSETLRKAPAEAVLAWLVERGLADWRRRLANRIFGLTEEAALAYGQIMGEAVHQRGGMSAPDGMIAAIARVKDGRLATRNLEDFETTGLELVSPWAF